VRLEKALARNDTEEALEAIRGNHRLLRRIGVVPDRVSDFIAAVENRGGAAKICGAGAAGGEAGGVVLVTGIRPPADLCEAFGYSLVSVRGEPLGVRIV
jgi:mevalonate kinase